MRRMPLALLSFLFLLSAANAIFLVGEGHVGEEISVICDNQERIFVSSPDGAVMQLDLDSAYQVEFVPKEAGPYTVQCGKEAATIIVEDVPGSSAGMEKEREDALIVLAAAGIFFAAFIAAALLLAKKYFSKNVFSKMVEGNRARLHLRVANKLEKIEIEDPVSFSHPGKPLRFSISRLDAGKDWSWEYDIATPEKALPATLEAMGNGKKISMLSKLFMGGEELKMIKSGAGALPPIKRKLQKAA